MMNRLSTKTHAQRKCQLLETLQHLTACILVSSVHQLLPAASEKKRNSTSKFDGLISIKAQRTFIKSMVIPTLVQLFYVWCYVVRPTGTDTLITQPDTNTGIEWNGTT